jgi:subtilisin family serine protease
MPRKAPIFASLAALLLAVACRDTVGVDHSAVPEPVTRVTEYAGTSIATFNCTISVADRATTCKEVAPSGSAGGASLALLGSSQIKMASSNNQYDSITEIYGFDATMQNLLTQAIGTPDGQTRVGSKVFFETGPTASSYTVPGDTGTVRVRNADGTAHYTGPSQPYFFYDTILQPQQVSAVRRWEFDVPREVANFRFTVKIFTAIRTERKVPLVAPDSIPNGFYDSANVMLNSPYFGMSRRAVKGIVAIRFNSTATPDERQSAVDMIKGRVVGGLRPSDAMEGSYFVKITDDGTGKQMRAAVDTLARMPSIATAKPELLWMPEEFLAYVEPEDDGAFRRPWQVSPTGAAGDNWAAEAVGLPGAWGCTTGSFGPKIAVLDMGFFSNSDLAPNIGYAPALDAYKGIQFVDDSHGTAVASIMGARGNNQEGITGAMWQANLRLHDISVADDGDRATVKAGLFGLGRTPRPMERLIQERLLQAINSGADVINISLAGRVDPDSFAQANWPREISSTTDELYHIIRSSPNKPLIVIGAGNFGATTHGDAYWSVFPNLAKLLPDQVIVVGGVDGVTETSANMWFKSSYNSSGLGLNLVQIAAPAVDVGVLLESGTGQKDGTSMSAPMVSGIAGLLKSFDPRLTAADIKALLLEGARRGGRMVNMSGSVYLANAYHSLVAASERPGAPLCGGVPVWRDEEFGLVQSRKIIGSSIGTVESLFLQAGSNLVSMQGETSFRVDQNYYGWFGGSWLPYPTARQDLFGNATNRSKLGQSHDGDSTVTVSRVEVTDSTEIYRLMINGSLLAEVPSTWAKKPASPDCVRFDAGFNCLSPLNTWYDRINTTPAVAFSPRGDEVVLAISREKSTYRVEVPYGCFGNQYCRDHGLEVNTLASDLVFVRISDGAIAARRSGPTRSVQRLGFSEEGQRLVFETQFQYYYSTSVTSSGDSYSSSTWYCQAQYTTRGGAALFTLPLKRQMSQCYTTASFSP